MHCILPLCFLPALTVLVGTRAQAARQMKTWFGQQYGLGDGMSRPPKPDIYLIGGGEAIAGVRK